MGKASSKETIEAGRQMAIVFYRFFVFDLEKSLWTAYLQSGLGQLQSNRVSNAVGPSVWPIEVQSAIEEPLHDNDHVACLAYVNRHLSELNDRMYQHQATLAMQKQHLSDDWQTIEAFVQRGLAPVRLSIEHQIAIVYYQYNDRVSELEYRQQHPTRRQVS